MKGSVEIRHFSLSWNLHLFFATGIFILLRANYNVSSVVVWNDVILLANFKHASHLWPCTGVQLNFEICDVSSRESCYRWSPSGLSNGCLSFVPFRGPFSAVSTSISATVTKSHFAISSSSPRLPYIIVDFYKCSGLLHGFCTILRATSCDFTRDSRCRKHSSHFARFANHFSQIQTVWWKYYYECTFQKLSD